VTVPVSATNGAATRASAMDTNAAASERVP
jgi:hypothetical protein